MEHILGYNWFNLLPLHQLLACGACNKTTIVKPFNLSVVEGYPVGYV
jgi:hypothetical protein